MKPLYGFGHTQEDERTEAAGLQLPGGSVLSITSAGEMPLSLLALGADRVVGVDIDPRQNHLAWLKLAAVRALAREDAIRFLGYLHASAEERLAWLDRLLPLVPAPTAEFWREHRGGVEHGPIWAGKFEHYLRLALKLAGPVLSRPFRKLAECASLEEQREVFRETLDRPAIHAIFRLVFSRMLYGGRGLEEQALQHYDESVPLGERFFGSLRSLCETTPASTNPFLQLFALGEVLSVDIVPAYLTAEGFAQVRARPDALRFVDGDVTAFLRGTPAGTFDKFHLSNVTDWMPYAEFETLLGVIVERCKRPARLVWRAIHAGVGVPAKLADAVVVDVELGQALRRRDRFPMYRVMPAEVR